MVPTGEIVDGSFRAACEVKIPKLHLTDAFSAEELRPVAEAARDDTFSTVRGPGECGTEGRASGGED